MFYLDTLPSYIRSILFSSAFNAVMEELKAALNFSSDQRSALEYILTDLFEKKIKPENLPAIFQTQLKVTAEQADMLERTFFINLVLPFTDFFGNHIEYFQKKYGDPEKALEESKTMPLLLKIINDALREKAAEIDALDNNREKEAIDMAALFQKNLTCHFYTPDDPYKDGLNNTIIFLISNVEGFVDTLLKSLYVNEERIGKETIKVGDKDELPATVGNWIQDILGFSGGMISSIKIAQYMTDNENVKKLPPNDKEALRRLFETFAVLKNFPESFEKTSPEHWMVIPYHLADEETKTARELPEVPGAVGSEDEVQKATGFLTTVRDDSGIAAVEMTETGSRIKSGMTINPPTQAVVQKEFSTPASPLMPVDYDRVIAHILEVVALKISDDVVTRVKPILSSRIRNIRNSIDTGERLKAALTDGGAGLVSEDADKLLKETNSAAQAIVTGKAEEYLPKAQNQEEVQNKITETGSRITSGMTRVEMVSASSADKSRVTVADAGSDLPMVAEENTSGVTVPEVPAMTIKEVNGVPTLVEKKNGNGKKKEISVEQATVSEPVPIATPKEKANVSMPVPEVTLDSDRGAEKAPIDMESRIKSGVTVAETTPSSVPAHLADAKPIPVTVRAVPAAGTPKTKVTDVKAPPRLVGVVDEIRALTIRDFRRLSQDPTEAAKRIYQKIQALEKESLTKKAEAIKAWKESDVYALYLEIGQINLGVDMNKLIEERKVAGKEYLTSDEFDALLDLSEKLRF